MKLEQTIQMCLDKHAPTFENRKQVLIHLFISFGTGFEWKNGELINTMDDGWKKFTGKLGEDGKAKQFKSIENVALKLTYESLIQDNAFEIPTSYEKFIVRINGLKKELEVKGLTLENTILSESIKMIKILRESHEKYMKSRISRKHSPIFNVPADIKQDWIEGIAEMKEIAKELNLDLDSIK